MKATAAHSISRREALKLGCAATMSAGMGTSGPSKTQAEANNPFADYDALALAELVRQRKVTPRELVEAAIRRAKAVNPKINAIVIPLYDAARNAARRELPDGPFKGVPFLVKDLGFAMRDVGCTNGSKLFQDYRPPEDSTSVKRIRRAGLVIMGRTHSPEFGLTATSESALYGVTHNPWNFELTAGGSSGGSAAAVAAGIVPMATGSDGGGSIRIPASCCGLFGMKPTRGRVPLGPSLYELISGLAVAGGITRSVRDSAALLDAIGGPVLGDPYGHPLKARPFLCEVGAPPGKLRIGLVTQAPRGTEVDPDCLKAVEQARRLCERLGHRVCDVNKEFARTFQPAYTPAIWQVTPRLAVESRLAELNRDLKDDDLEYVTRSGFEAAADAKALALTRERRALHAMSRRMAEFQRDYDVLLMPTLGQKPVALGHLALTRRDVQGFYTDLAKFNPFCLIANQTGQPAMSVPLHWTDDEKPLPIGVQFFGRFGDEATLFRLAGQLEREEPWASRRPTL